MLRMIRKAFSRQAATEGRSVLRVEGRTQRSSHLDSPKGCRLVREFGCEGDVPHFMRSFITSPYVIRNRSLCGGPAKNRLVIFLIDYKLYYKLCDRGNKCFEALLQF